MTLVDTGDTKIVTFYNVSIFTYIIRRTGVHPILQYNQSVVIFMKYDESFPLYISKIFRNLLCVYGTWCVKSTLVITTKLHIVALIIIYIDILF